MSVTENIQLRKPRTRTTLRTKKDLIVAVMVVVVSAVLSQSSITGDVEIGELAPLFRYMSYAVSAAFVILCTEMAVLFRSRKKRTIDPVMFAKSCLALPSLPLIGAFLQPVNLAVSISIFSICSYAVIRGWTLVTGPPTHIGETRAVTYLWRISVSLSMVALSITLTRSLGLGSEKLTYMMSPLMVILTWPTLGLAMTSTSKLQASE